MCADHVARTKKERFSSISQKRHAKVQVFGKCEGAFRQILKCGVEAIGTLTGELSLPEVHSALQTLTLCTSQINVLSICGGMLPVCLFALVCFVKSWNQVIDALKALDIKIGTVYVLDIDLEAIGVGVHHHPDVVIKILKTADAHGAVHESFTCISSH